MHTHMDTRTHLQTEEACQHFAVADPESIHHSVTAGAFAGLSELNTQQPTGLDGMRGALIALINGAFKGFPAAEEQILFSADISG